MSSIRDNKQTLRETIDAMKIKVCPKKPYVFKPRDEPLEKPQPKSPKIRGSAGEMERMMFEKLEHESSQRRRRRNLSPEVNCVAESYSKFAALYGGNNFTNEQSENLIKTRQREAELRQSDGSSSSTRNRSTYHDNSDTVSQVSSEHSSVNTAMIKEIYNKNAAINGLLEQNIINMRDLKMSYRRTSLEAPNKSIPSIPVEIEHPDIPNLMVHRLLVEGAPEINGIDYTPDRLAVRDYVSPQDVLLNIPDEDFAFVKPRTSSKRKVNDPFTNTSPGLDLKDTSVDSKNADRLNALFQNVKSDNPLMYKFLFPEENSSEDKTVISENSEGYLSM